MKALEPGAVRIENNGTQVLLVQLGAEESATADFIQTKVNPIEILPNTSESIMLHGVTSIMLMVKD